MDWFYTLLTSSTVAHSLLMLALVIVLGLFIGGFKIKGFTLGVTWILFVGIFFGSIPSLKVDPGTLHFVKELGLILFVYSIGMQVGPSFFSTFRSGGVKMNMLAVGLVVLNVLAAYLLSLLFGEDLRSMVGILSGAVTNTPGLGAAQQAYTDATGELASFLAAGYAISYPMGVVGVLLCLMVMGWLCKDQKQEEKTEEKSTVEIYSVRITNKSSADISLGELKRIIGKNFVVTRLLRAGAENVTVPNDDTLFHLDDKIYVISNSFDTPAIVLCLGERIEMDTKMWDKVDNTLISKKLVVTKSVINGKSLEGLKIREVFGVNISRVIRTGIGLVPRPDLKLQVGDVIVAVGEETSVNKLGLFVGNKNTELDHPHLLQIFLGITLGVILGSIPMDIPGIPQPVKLGLAGGPLIVSILIARFGTKWGLVTYTTFSAKKMLQEIGIMLFLAAVGLGAGDGFIDTFRQQGVAWFAYGSIITIVPMIIILLIGRFALKMTVPQLMGFASGATTNPPALAFSAQQDETGKAALSYATVYPLTMFLRVMSAQFLILMAL